MEKKVQSKILSFWFFLINFNDFCLFVVPNNDVLGMRLYKNFFQLFIAFVVCTHTTTKENKHVCLIIKR